MLGELSVRVPIVDFDLHKAQTEARRRKLRSGEPIVVSKLALPVDELPAFADPKRPSRAEAEAVAVKFFSLIEWAEEPQALEAPTWSAATASADRSLDPSSNQTPDLSLEVSSFTHAGGVVLPIRPQGRGDRNRTIDLSVLDR